MHNLRRGDRGSVVAEVRSMLASIGLLNNTDEASLDVLDEAAELAVRHFQQRRGISVDGIVGPETFATLTEAHWRLGDRVLAHEAGSPLAGDDVAAPADPAARARLRPRARRRRLRPDDRRVAANFQRDYGLVARRDLRAGDVAGPASARSPRRRRAPQLLREQVAVADSGPSLFGKRIVLDPGHGGDDPGRAPTTARAHRGRARLGPRLAARGPADRARACRPG